MVTRRRHRGAGPAGTRRPIPTREIAFTPGPRPAAGLHRRAGRRRPRRHARRHGRAWAATRSGSTRSSRSSWSSTTRSRSTSSAAPRRFLINAELEFERNRERYAFLRWGQTAFDNFQVVPPDTGIVHQVNLEYLARVVLDERAIDGATLGLSRHAGRHRLAHDDDQRPRRARLGRRRHRGRGGHARPAGLDAHPAGRRLPARRPAARGGDGHRPGADRHPDAAQEGRGRQVRRVLRRRPGRPAAGRPRHDRQHGPRVRRDLRHLPGRRRRRSTTCASPAGRTSWSRWSRPTARSRACSTRPTTPGGRRTPTRWSSTSATVEPSLAGPAPAAGPRPPGRRQELVPEGAARR